MDIINSLLLANLPSGFWQNLIGYVVDFVGNFGLAIVVFSIILKIVLSPLDYMQRKITKNNTEKQAILKPQLDKINKKYENNKEKLNQKTMELYKKENYNVMGSCFGMILNLALTLVIFISLFTALRDISEFKIAEEFNTLKSVYDTELLVGDISSAEQAVSDEYDLIKENFLWVNNIWMPDTRTTIIPGYDKFVSLSKLAEEDLPTEAEYQEVVGALQIEYDGWNGLYILILLAGVVSFISQKVMTSFTKKKKPEEEKPKKDGEEAMPQINTQFMLYLLPVLMIFFTLQYSAAFALYIVMNSIMTTVISAISYSIISRKDNKDPLKPEYSR